MRYPMFMVKKVQCIKDISYFQSNCGFNAILVKNPRNLFVDKNKFILKFMRRKVRSSIVRHGLLETKNKFWRTNTT